MRRCLLCCCLCLLLFCCACSETAKIPEQWHIQNVPVLSQFPDYPTGCETVSAVMALQYLGEQVQISDFLQHLPCSDDFYYRGFKRYGPSPYQYFVGDPRSENSWGCMSPVIREALCGYLGNSEQVLDVGGTDLPTLCRQYICNDLPVILWVTIRMLEVKPTNSWYLQDGSYFTWPGNEHCMLLVGYDADYYYLNDPYDGETVRYPKETVQDRYNALGKQALVVTAEP